MSQETVTVEHSFRDFWKLVGFSCNHEKGEVIQVNEKDLIDSYDEYASIDVRCLCGKVIRFEYHTCQIIEDQLTEPCCDNWNPEAINEKYDPTMDEIIIDFKCYTCGKITTVTYSQCSDKEEYVNYGMDDEDIKELDYAVF